MRIEVRPVGRLRGADPVDLTGCIGSIVESLSASTADLSRVRVVCDWIQYRSSFREVADLRPVLPAVLQAEVTEPGIELAVDLRRCADVDLRALVTGLLAEHASEHAPAGTSPRTPAGTSPRTPAGTSPRTPAGTSPRTPAGTSPRTPAGTSPQAPARISLEPWGAGTASCVWRFNTLYWQALSAWEQATGREYEKSLPGGKSHASNISAVRDLILELFKVWDDLDARGALPAELYVVELGVGNGSQARTWLDEFVALSSAHSRDYYRRLHYLMGDYSPHVLSRARQAVAHHGDHVNALVVDATHPAISLGFLSGKAFLVYISNVYDNLPSDEVARVGGRAYQVQVRAFLPAAAARRIARRFSAPARKVPDLVSKLLRLGPELLCDALPQHFSDPARAVAFWQQVWAALRLQERYMPLEGLDLYQIGPDLTGEMLRAQLESDGDIRIHVNNGALSSFAETLPLLHPFGRLQCHDLFVTDVRDYHRGFYGPGKYDGSVVNWVNGPLLRHVGGRAGFDVRISPFAQRPSSNIKTLTAAVRE